MIENELRNEIVGLKSQVDRLHREKRELEERLWSITDKKEAAEKQRDSLQSEKDRRYDVYVTDTHEGYMPQADYDDLEQIIEHYEAMAIYVNEMRVRPDWYASHPEMFAKSETEWRIVDHQRNPINFAHLTPNAALDLPSLDIGYESRCRHLLTGEIIKSDPGVPLQIAIKD